MDVMRKVVSVFLPFLVSGLSLAASAQHDHASGVAVSHLNQAIYVAGGSSGSMISAGHMGGVDAWLARYDVNGQQLWLQHFGSTRSESAVAVVADSNGDALVLGYGLDEQGHSDAWVVRFAEDGSQLWRIALLEMFPDAIGLNPTALVLDRAGNLYITGALLKTDGTHDAFLVKTDSQGQLQWIRNMGVDDDDFAFNVTTDPEGDALVVGYTNGNLSGRLNQGGKDAWVARYAADGGLQWLYQWGGAGDDFPVAIGADPNGDIVVAGYTQGEPRGENPTDYDTWLKRIDAEGKPLWNRRMGSSSQDEVAAVVINGEGRIYVAGNTQANSGSDNAHWNVWVAQWDRLGTSLGVRMLGAPDHERVRSMALDEDGMIYLGGDIEEGGVVDSKLIGRDAWVAQLDNTAAVVWLDLFGSEAGAQPPLGNDLTRNAIAPSSINRQASDQWGQHLVFLNSSAPVKDNLLVFLPRTGAPPEDYELFLSVAANMGYRAIGLAYPNSGLTVGQLCAGITVGDCFGEVRKETITGQDVSSKVQVSKADSISNRLWGLLRYLDTAYPDQGWSQWLRLGQPRWSSIIVAGHSQGGGHAAMVGKLYRTARVVMLSSVEDTQKSGQPAGWIGSEGKTPAAAYYAFDHLHDPFWPHNRDNWVNFGLASEGGIVNVDSVTGFGGSHRLSTTLLPSTGASHGVAPHNSPAVDSYTPLDANGGALYGSSGVWSYLLEGQ